MGNFYELWAIAAAVLGGCSLRGGEGSVLGVLIGAAVLQVLRNAKTLLGIPARLDFAVVGIVILAGVTTEELLRRWADRRRGVQEAAATQDTPGDAASVSNPARPVVSRTDTIPGPSQRPSGGL